jgi:hypothetical protein
MTKPKLQRAQELDAKFKAMRSNFRKAWIRYGHAAIEFDEQELYKLVGHTSFKAYWKAIPGAMPYSTIAEAMHVARTFGDWGEEELAKYQKENLKLLAKLPESKRTKASVLKACREMKAGEFREYLNLKHKTLIDKPVRRFIDFEQTQTITFDGAVALCQKIGEAHKEKINVAEAVEIICIHFLQSFQDKKPKDVEIAKPKRGIELA